MHGTLALSIPDIDPPPAGAENGLVPRATVEVIVRHRNHAIELYDEAHRAMTLGHKAMVKASTALSALHKREGAMNYHIRGERTAFMHVNDVQEHKDYMTIARRLVDTEVWAHIIEITDLERLMDKQAKEELHKQL